MTLRAHDIVLSDSSIRLRPMTEDEWDLLYGWNNDPEVLYYSEGDDVAERSLADVQRIYRAVSQTAFNFMIEVGGETIGECWLQEMNMDYLLKQFPAKDCRRIDLVIGEKEYWGRGIGTRSIALLKSFAFDVDKADLIFGVGVADYNSRSRRAFEKNGFSVHQIVEQPPGDKAGVCYDMIVSHS